MSSPMLPIPCIDGDKGPTILGVGGTFLSISVILTGLRIYTRTQLVRAGLGWDDASIMIAVAFVIPLFSLTVKHVHYGLGRHVGCLSPMDVINADKIQAIGEIPVMISSLFSRVSICLFLLRLFAINKRWRWTLYSIIAVTALTNITSATAILLKCQPRAKMWDPAIPGTCWSQKIEVGIGQLQGGISVFLDLVLSALPIYCMWKIQTSWRIKAAICGIMSLGVFTACCLLVRTIVLGRISGDDITWDSIVPSVVGDLEVYVSIIAANIATLRPLFTRRSGKPDLDRNQHNESKRRLDYAKLSAESNGLDKWPGDNFNTKITICDTERTVESVSDEEISLQHMGGIRKIRDVQVTV